MGSEQERAAQLDQLARAALSARGVAAPAATREEPVVRRPQPSRPGAHKKARRLSPREREIVRGLADGLTPDQIAARRGLSSGTVREYLRMVRIKLSRCGGLDAFTTAVRDGSVELTDPLAGPAPAGQAPGEDQRSGRR